MKQEPLRHKSGTDVREDFESLESLKALDAALQKEEKQAKAKPRRESTRVEAEVTHALLEGGQLGGRMRKEVASFVEAFPGVAPDAGAFAERLVDILLRAGAGEAYDVRTAEELYGDFTGCFLANDWKEPRLRVGRHVVLSAAALA